MKKKFVFLILLVIFIGGLSKSILAQHWVKIEEVVPTTTCEEIGALCLVSDSLVEIDSVFLGTTKYDVTNNDTIWLNGLATGVYDSTNIAILNTGDTIAFGSFYVEEDGPVFYSQDFSLATCGNNGWVRGTGHGDIAILLDSSLNAIEDRYIVDGGWEFDSIPPGSYFVRIIDWWGCSDLGPLFVIEPDEVKIQEKEVSYDACGAEGWIRLEATNADSVGLHTADSVLFFVGGSSFAVDSLMPGSYMIVANAMAGCQNDTSFVLIKEEKVLPTLIDTKNTAFCGSPYGEVFLSFDRDIDFVYDYPDADIHCAEAQIAGLTDGYHTITVELVNQCMSECVVNIGKDEAPELQILEIEAPTCLESSDGYFEYWTLGSVDSILWADEVVPGDIVENLASGGDTLYVFDRECVVKKYIEVPESNGECIHVYWQFTPNGDQYNETLEISSPEGSTLEITVYDKRGRLVYQSSDYKNDWNGIDQTGAPVPSGDYLLTVQATLPSGKLEIKKVTINIKTN